MVDCSYAFLTLGHAVSAVAIVTGPAVAAVPARVVAAVCKAGALLPVVGTRLIVVGKHCEGAWGDGVRRQKERERQKWHVSTQLIKELEPKST